MSKWVEGSMLTPTIEVEMRNEIHLKSEHNWESKD